MRYRLISARFALACACAQLCAATATAADECVIGRGSPATSTFPIRLFGGVIRIPVDYTLYGDEALSRRGARLLEFRDLSQSGALASISIGNVADAGGELGNVPVLCTTGALTVRQSVRSSAAATVIHDDKYYLTMLSTDANAWRVLLQEFEGK